jgi:hypothetical protein
MLHEREAQYEPVWENISVSICVDDLKIIQVTTPVHLARYRFVRLLLIWLNAVTISLAEVNKKNLEESVAQFCSNVEVGSPPVPT